MTSWTPPGALVPGGLSFVVISGTPNSGSSAGCTLVALIVSLIPFIAAWALPKYAVRSTIADAGTALTLGQIDVALATAEEAPPDRPVLRTSPGDSA